MLELDLTQFVRASVSWPVWREAELDETRFEEQTVTLHNAARWAGESLEALGVAAERAMNAD